MSASTAAPQLRTTTAAAKSQSQSQTTDKSPRIPPPQQSIVEDHFYWTYSDEPHRSRRQAIIKAHPEVTKLCGPEPITKYVVLGVVLVQITCAYLLRDTSMLSWKFLATAYLIGATANQNLFMAIHEISHNLAFKSPMGNRVLAMLANWPIGIPYSAAFRPYHLTHHKSLGVVGLDTDLPTALEAFFLDSLLGKAFFCTFQILFYALRPMFIYSPPFTSIHLLNIIVQLSFDYTLTKVCNGSLQPLFYFVLSSFMAGSLHPLAGHFVSEHYFFSNVKSGGTESISELKKRQRDESESESKSSTGTGTDFNESTHPMHTLPPPETYSYYGPGNIFVYNVGLHNEHHDFPAIPWTKLPVLHEIAREFYEPLPCHRSWSWVIWTFILDRDVGMWCRVKREKGGRVVGGGSGGKGKGRNSSGRGGERISGTSADGKEDGDADGDGDGDGWRESEIQN